MRTRKSRRIAREKLGAHGRRCALYNSEVTNTEVEEWCLSFYLRSWSCKIPVWRAAGADTGIGFSGTLVGFRKRSPWYDIQVQQTRCVSRSWSKIRAVFFFICLGNLRTHIGGQRQVAEAVIVRLLKLSSSITPCYLQSKLWTNADDPLTNKSTSQIIWDQQSTCTESSTI